MHLEDTSDSRVMIGRLSILEDASDSKVIISRCTLEDASWWSK